MAHGAKQTRRGQVTLKWAEARASEARRVAELAGLRAPQPVPPSEAVRLYTKGGETGASSAWRPDDGADSSTRRISSGAKP